MIEPIFTRNIYDDGVQEFYRFDNGYGASVVQHSFLTTGDLWEIAPIKFYGPDIDDWHFVNVSSTITYDIRKSLPKGIIYKVLEELKTL